MLVCTLAENVSIDETSLKEMLHLPCISACAQWSGGYPTLLQKPHSLLHDKQPPVACGRDGRSLEAVVSGLDGERTTPKAPCSSLQSAVSLHFLGGGQGSGHV
eukprot:scaffold60_cov325-Pavlova_lutheri.AAC.9